MFHRFYIIGQIKSRKDQDILHLPRLSYTTNRWVFHLQVWWPPVRHNHLRQYSPLNASCKNHFAAWSDRCLHAHRRYFQPSLFPDHFKVSVNKGVGWWCYVINSCYNIGIDKAFFYGVSFNYCCIHHRYWTGINRWWGSRNTTICGISNRHAIHRARNSDDNWVCGESGVMGAIKMNQKNTGGR